MASSMHSCREGTAAASWLMKWGSAKHCRFWQQAGQCFAQVAPEDALLFEKCWLWHRQGCSCTLLATHLALVPGLRNPLDASSEVALLWAGMGTNSAGCTGVCVEYQFLMASVLLQCD